MPLAIQAVERYGRDAFVVPTFLENLLQTDATVAWLIQEIERVGASTDEREDRYASALVTALCHADPAVLKQHEATIQAMGNWMKPPKRSLPTASTSILLSRMPCGES